MRKKYNEKVAFRDNTERRSNIYLKYYNYIEDLLTPTIDSYNEYSYDKLYVQHPMYNILKQYTNKRNIDTFLYLTGLTGTGKSSLLKYTFKHYENSLVFNKNMLVIPFTCNNHVGNTEQIRKRLTDLFFSVTNEICERYNLKKFNRSIDDFVSYIKNRRGQFSVNQRGWKEISAEELLDQLYEDDSLELALLAFKYSMSQEKNEINRVIFIMDDIESVGLDMEIKPIYLAHKVMACLNNRSKNEKKKWCCTVVVACRHYVYRILTTKRKDSVENGFSKDADISRSTMESFWSDDIDINLKDCPTLKAIIKKREETIETFMNEEEKQDFKEICNVINDIVKSAGDLLLSLNVNNYRTTLIELKRIICNKRWLQKIDNNSGAFKIGTAEENYFSNKSNIIRAIAMGENDVYFGERSIIPNLLQNREDGGDLWILIVIGIFVKNTENSWNSSLNLDDIKKRWNIIFGEKELYIRELHAALYYLIEKRLLLRGKFEEQRDSVDLTSEDMEKVKYVYTSNATIILWNYLAKSSILFELFVDDVWIENSIRKDVDLGRKYVQFNLYNFRECINYLNYLIAEECNIRRFLINRNSVKEYINLFGDKPVTQQLLCGLKRSYNNYFKEKSIVDEMDVLKLESQLENLEVKIKQCKDLFVNQVQ